LGSEEHPQLYSRVRIAGRDTVRGSSFFDRLGAALLGALVIASVGVGSASVVRAAAEIPFPRPSTIEPNIGFWVDVFTAYSVRDFVLVDSTRVWRIYAVYHLPGDGQPSRDDIQWVNAYLKDKYSHILSRLAAGEEPITYDERRVAALFKGQPRGAYRVAQDNLRVQEGLRERFRKGLLRSRYYRATMERIFRDAGLPPELVTLAQIESGFQTRARSSAGAAGIWQFTRSTGRKYMHVSRYRDDRLNPYRSTIAAAKLLRSNYDLLGDWPLAITAYNYGTGGIARAANEYNGDYGKLIQQYNGPHFGFAVKNYYAEFLAALQVHRYEDAYFPGIENESAQIVDTHSYTVRHGDTPSSIAQRFGISPSRLMDANGISNARYLRVGATLVIPAAPMGATAENIWRPVDSSSREHHHAAHDRSDSNAAQRQSAHSTRHHRIRRGETLYRVADDYDVPVKALMKANGIENPRRVRAGTMLVIPQI
jgi:membrane-bound lytic murein transglycosylase D